MDLFCISSVDIGDPVPLHLNLVTFICSILVGVLSGGAAVFGYSSVSEKFRCLDFPWHLSIWR